MAETSNIEWTDATGRQLGAYKTAAARTGCTVTEWLAHRSAGRRWCFRCKGWKEKRLFSLDKSRSGGTASTCKPCTSDASTASRYGLRLDDLNAMRAEHNGACAICARQTVNLYVDHDHATGKVRGLLCPCCNTAIGQLNEDPVLFAAALAYLEKHRG